MGIGCAVGADKVKVIVLGCEQKEMGCGDWVCCW